MIFRRFSSGDVGLSMSPRALWSYCYNMVMALFMGTNYFIINWCVFIVNMRVSCPCTWFGILRHNTEDGVIFFILNMKIYRNSKSYLFSITRENERLLWLDFGFLWLMVFIHYNCWLSQSFGSSPLHPEYIISNWLEWNFCQTTS